MINQSPVLTIHIILYLFVHKCSTKKKTASAKWTNERRLHLKFNVFICTLILWIHKLAQQTRRFLSFTTNCLRVPNEMGNTKQQRKKEMKRKKKNNQLKQSAAKYMNGAKESIWWNFQIISKNVIRTSSVKLDAWNATSSTNER